MSLFFVAGIYFYARGIFALFGQTIFYTKQVLEKIAPEDIKPYLKESGVWHVVTGTVFVGKALLDVVFPYHKVVLWGFFALLILCVVFLSRCNEKYSAKE